MGAPAHIETLSTIKQLDSMRSIIGCLFLCMYSCSGVQTSSESSKKMDNLEGATPQQIDTTQYQSASIRDSRDGETYKVVSIGDQTWMAENLRYTAPGARLNPDNPSITYGRLYDGLTVQTSCPDGWHLPSDEEWSKLEMVLGLPASDTGKTEWRGEHAAKMKSVTGWSKNWSENLNGTNSSGFNVFPAGYYLPDDGFGGLGMSSGFWTSAENGVAWMRWFAGPKAGVNRYYDDKLDSSGGAACRCVQD